MKRLFYYIGITFFCLKASFAQTTITYKEFYKDVEQTKPFYEGDYCLGISYKSFKDYKTTVASDQSSGFLYKKKDVFIANQLSSYSIQDSKVRFVVDSIDRVVGISAPLVLNQSQTGLDQIKDSYNFIESITKTERGNYTTYTLKYAEGYTYDHVNLTLIKNQYISDLELFFATHVVSENNGIKESNKPRVKISYRLKPMNEYTITDFKSIALEENGNYQLHMNYKDFQLIDLRIRP